MAPSVVDVPVANEDTTVKGKFVRGLKSSGSLDKFARFDVTPAIGTEFRDVQLADLLSSANADELIRDLAILGTHSLKIGIDLVSQRNVVFFRGQDITAQQQETLGTKLGELSGKPATSKLHIHPLTEEFSEFGDYISVISSEFNQIRHDAEVDDKTHLASSGWHSEYQTPTSSRLTIALHSKNHHQTMRF
jgi:hypothetical protein